MNSKQNLFNSKNIKLQIFLKPDVLAKNKGKFRISTKNSSKKLTAHLIKNIRENLLTSVTKSKCTNVDIRLMLRL